MFDHRKGIGIQGIFEGAIFHMLDILDKRLFLYVSWFWGLLFLGSDLWSGGIWVQDKKVEAIMLPKGASPALSEAAKCFSRVLQRSTGESLPIQQGKVNADEEAVICLSIRSAVRHTVGPQFLHSQVFYLSTLPGRLLVEASDDQALVSALYYLMQHYGDVRWYMPGLLGEDILVKERWEVGYVHQREISPAYYSVHLAGLHSGEGREWFRRNYAYPSMDFSHNFHRILTAEDYQSYPEWFADSYKRKYHVDHRFWQPHFLQETLPHAVGERASEFFVNHPDRYTYAVGVNDSMEYDVSQRTLDFLEPLTYFRRRPNYSDAVYLFNNRVAQVLSESHPHHYLGALAYYWCEQVPSFSVHPKVIPFLTSDRGQYYDSAYKNQDQELIGQWGRAGSEFIGIYDYFESGVYWVPRLPLHEQLGAISFAYQQGARAYYAEVYPAWAWEGPRAWAAIQLCWNPDRSLGDLLSEYYLRFYREVAEPMREFYTICEAVWGRQTGRGRWLKYFRHKVQFDLYDEATMLHLQGLLKKAQGMAKAKIVKERVAWLSSAFRVFYAGWEWCRMASELVGSDIIFDAQMIEGQLIEWNRLERAYDEALALLEGIKGVTPVDIESYRRLKVSLNPWPTVLERLSQRGLEATWSGKGVDFGEAVISKDTLRSENLLKNSFFSGEVESVRHPLAKSGLPVIKGWDLEAEPDETTFAHFIDNGKEGRSLHIRGATRMWLKQMLFVESGVPYHLSWSSRGKVGGYWLRVSLIFYDQNGKKIGYPHSRVFIYPRIKEDIWRPYAVAAVSPENAKYIKVEWYIGGQDADEWVEIGRPRLQSR